MLARIRLFALRYSILVYSLAGLGVAFFVLSAARLIFDYARSMQAPSVRQYAHVPLLHETLAYGYASIVNAVSRMPSGATAPIDTVNAIVAQEDLSLLGTRRAKATKLVVDGRVWVHDRWLAANVSLRGDNVFHWGSELKSYRFRFKQGETVDAQRELNIVNPKDAGAFSLLYGEYTGRRLGLAVPGTKPCRFILNGQNLGVYLCQYPLNEAWLRQEKHIPGNLYAGDYLIYGYGSDFTSASKLWDTPGLWQPLAGVPGVGDTQADLRAYLEIIAAIARAPSSADVPKLLERLQRIADVDAFLKLWATQTWSNSIHQDEFHNWRLYFDPSRGVFEPIVWDTLRVWSGTAEAALDAPLPRPFQALMRFPELNQRRYEILYRQLVGPELTSGIGARWAHDFAVKTRSTVMSAAGIDRITWSPNVLMWATVDRFQVIKDQKADAGYVRRHAAGLAAVLETVVLENQACVAVKSSLQCRFQLMSPAGLSLEGRQIEDGKTQLLHHLGWNADGHVFGTGEYQSSDARVSHFYPAMATSADPSFPLRYAARRAATVQTFRINSVGASGTGVTLVFRNQVSGRRHLVVFPVVQQWGALASESAFTFKPNNQKPMPELSLGPGLVILRSTLETGWGQRLTINPGTTLLMDPGVSLIVRGELRMEGSAKHPIVMRANRPHLRWGGLLVMGEATRGSRFRHCDISGGTLAKYGIKTTTGMVDIAHTDDLVIEDCRFADNELSDDTLHILQVPRVALRRVTVEQGRSDCLDFDYARGTIEQFTARGCGNDGLDFMGSVFQVRNSLLTGCGDKGASVGEKSNVWFSDTIFSGDSIGVQAKDMSQAFLSRAIVFQGNRVDVSAYEKSRYYERGGCVLASPAAAQNASLAIHASSRWRIAPGLAAPLPGWDVSGEGGACWMTR